MSHCQTLHAIDPSRPIGLDVKQLGDHVAEPGTSSILERRDMGRLNIGETGGLLYRGRGEGPAAVKGAGRFYILFAPAHQPCSAGLIKLADAVHGGRQCRCHQYGFGRHGRFAVSKVALR